MRDCGKSYLQKLLMVNVIIAVDGLVKQTSLGIVSGYSCVSKRGSFCS
jgi:hypothetical protein